MGLETQSNKRIVKNSLFLYIRMLILMGIGFYTVRVILEALGVEDLGIYNVVGSLIAIFDFVSSGLTNSTQRYINVGLGKGDKRLTNQYFSQSLIIHIGFAVFIALLAETVGLWFVYHKLVIPAGRLEAAVTVFHFTVIALVLRLIKICFESDIIAREKMSVYAYLSIFEGVAKLLICYAVIHNHNFDKLVYYGFLLLMVNLCITGFNIVYCLTKYPETHVRLYRDKAVYKQLLSFVGINSFGVISWAIGKQGLNIVLNLFCGPAVNGAKGIASNLDRVISQFGTNIDLAVRPQITKLYAQNKEWEMISLAMKSTKNIYFVELLVSIPFLFRTHDILSIWLKEVPAYTDLFVQLMALETLFTVLGSGFNTTTMALGKIKSTQVYGRLITLSILPLSYQVLRLTPNPLFPMIISIMLSLAYSVFLIYTVNRYVHFGLKYYLRAMAWPIFRTTALVLGGCYLLNNLFDITDKWLSCLSYTLFLCTYAAVVIFYCGMRKLEREWIIGLVKRRILKQ